MCRQSNFLLASDAGICAAIGRCGKTNCKQLVSQNGILFHHLCFSTGERVDSVRLGHLEGVRRGFSHGGRLRTANYDPLRSLSISVRKGKRDDPMITYNLKAVSAWTCQM